MYVDSLLDESCALEAFADVDGGLNDSKVQKALKEIGKILSGFAGGLIKFVTTIINKIHIFLNNINKKFDAERSIVSVEDKHDYIKVAHSASEIITTYYGYLMNVRQIDHEINQSVSIMDGMKNEIHSKTFGSRINKKSKRELTEEVIFYSDKMDACRDTLNELWQKANQLSEVSNPRRYSINYLRQDMKESFTDKLKMLQQLKSQLEITKKMYDDRKFMYRQMHKDDIKRNQLLLNHTSQLIKHTENFRSLYVLLFKQVIDMNNGQGQQQDDEDIFAE